MTVRAHDPEGMEHARGLLPGVELVDGPYSAVEGAHAVAIVTEWDAYRDLDLARIASLMAEPVLFDLRNVYSGPEAEAAGLAYFAIGRRVA